MSAATSASCKRLVRAASISSFLPEIYLSIYLSIRLHQARRLLMLLVDRFELRFAPRLDRQDLPIVLRPKRSQNATSFASFARRCLSCSALCATSSASCAALFASISASCCALSAFICASARRVASLDSSLIALTCLSCSASTLRLHLRLRPDRLELRFAIRPDRQELRIVLIAPLHVPLIFSVALILDAGQHHERGEVSPRKSTVAISAARRTL